MAETKKRIIQYNEAITFNNDDYLLIDGETDGTRKILASNVGGSGGGGINYSTTEQNTGLKWINDKPIYQKTVEIPTTSQHDPLQYTAHNIANAEFVGYEAFFIDSDGTIREPQYLNSGWRYYVEVNSTSIVWNNLHSATGTLYVTLRYTKTTDTVQS